MISLNADTGQLSPWFLPPTHATEHPGTKAIGLRVDEEGEVTWTFFDNEGVHSGVITGGAGLGKSALFDVLAASARATKYLNVMFVDPHGASSPPVRDAASITALGKTESLAAIEVLEREATSREAYLNVHGIGKIVPGKPVDCPEGCPCGGCALNGLMVFIDECAQVFGAKDEQGRDLAPRWAELVKRLRKTGVGFVVASQRSGLPMFGGSKLLRLNLAARNYVRLTERGYGYLSDAAMVECSELFRPYWLPRRCESESLPPDLDPPIWAEDALAASPEPELHPITRASAQRRTY